MFPEVNPPQPRRIPRTRLQGGFVMDRDTAIAWASRVANRQFQPDDIYWVWEILDEKVKKYGSTFSFVGEELDAEFMVVTQRTVVRGGYLGMDPAKIPRLCEGERESVARELLAKEGHYTIPESDVVQGAPLFGSEFTGWLLSSSLPFRSLDVTSLEDRDPSRQHPRVDNRKGIRSCPFIARPSSRVQPIPPSKGDAKSTWDQKLILIVVERQDCPCCWDTGCQPVCWLGDQTAKYPTSATQGDVRS
ncbi:hypothetical protein F5146DRAFT_1117795 [Armillaria mellea]|nr:hypothetical protein F5146DRAFT_1117795 [Armillaria mellea]